MGSTAEPEYLLSGGAAELERLCFQARVRVPASQQLLDSIGVSAGWRCLDLGCGGVGILGPLSRRVGSESHVLGIDRDPQQLAAARAHVEELKLRNVDVVEADAYATNLPGASSDLVHVSRLQSSEQHAD